MQGYKPVAQHPQELRGKGLAENILTSKSKNKNREKSNNSNNNNTHKVMPPFFGIPKTGPGIPMCLEVCTGQPCIFLSTLHPKP